MIMKEWNWARDTRLNLPSAFRRRSGENISSVHKSHYKANKTKKKKVVGKKSEEGQKKQKACFFSDFAFFACPNLSISKDISM